MKLTKFPIQLNNYIEEDELIYGNELIKRYILFFIPFFCISILEDCILNNLIFLLFYVPLKDIRVEYILTTNIYVHYFQ